jgi:hypothetical protein
MLGVAMMSTLSKQCRSVALTVLGFSALTTCCRTKGENPCSRVRQLEGSSSAPSAPVDSVLVARAAHLISWREDYEILNAQVDSTFGSDAPELLERLAGDTDLTRKLAERGQIAPFVPLKAAVLLGLRPQGIEQLDSMLASLAGSVQGRPSMSLNQTTVLLSLASGLDTVLTADSSIFPGAMSMLCTLREVGPVLSGNLVPSTNQELRVSAAAELRVKGAARLLLFLERHEIGWSENASARFLKSWPARSESEVVLQELVRARRHTPYRPRVSSYYGRVEPKSVPTLLLL